MTTDDEERPPLPFLVRNRALVNACQVLLGTPETVNEALRSGTWSTIRYAVREHRPVVLVDPDGSVRWFQLTEGSR